METNTDAFQLTNDELKEIKDSAVAFFLRVLKGDATEGELAFLSQILATFNKP
jgi:hypothetical protein